MARSIRTQTTPHIRARHGKGTPFQPKAIAEHASKNAPRRIDQTQHSTNEHGFTLMSVTLVLLLLVMLGLASTFYTVLDLRAATHYTTGNRALDAAEAGVLKALSAINATGVIDFRQDIATRWATIFGSDKQVLPNQPSMSYQVIAESDPTDPARKGSLLVTGYAPLSARRRLSVNLSKTGFYGSPGAIYLMADGGVGTTFNGTAFDIDGNDHTTDLKPVTNGPVRPGISTRNSAVSDTVDKSLTSGQKKKVKGLGFEYGPPVIPSVIPTGGPSVEDVGRLVDRLSSLPGTKTLLEDKLVGNSPIGTKEHPEVYIHEGDLMATGNTSGHGMLIVNGDFKSMGNFKFDGILVVRGDFESMGNVDFIGWIIALKPDGTGTTSFFGNTNIAGSLWTSALNLKAAGNTIVGYCDTCLRMADSMMGSNGALPRPMQITSWAEVL